MTRYVGFSEFYHDAGVSVIEEDGTVSYATHAERWSKTKNDATIPESLWDFVGQQDDEVITFYEDHKVKYGIRGGIAAHAGIYNKLTGDLTPGQITDKYGYTKHLNAHKMVPLYEALVFDTHHLHHESHVAGALYTRPWDSLEDTVCVSIDGAGEVQCSVIMDTNYNVIKEWHYPKSIGVIYGTVTKALGLRPLEDEYVVMGLSSYGEDEFSDWIYQKYHEFSDEAHEIENGVKIGEEDSEREQRRRLFRDELMHKCKKTSPENAAASVQEFARRAILEIMEIARQHGSKLVYSGGCAQNVVINSLIHEMFDEVHIAIAPADSGSSLGCAAKTWAEATGKDKLIWTPYMGTNIDREINPKEVVDHLMQHQYCGVANGRAEFGPRALGNRSLIADVRFDVKDTVNEIKRRQKYRPFAPAILEEFADQYFEGPMNEYMQFTSKALHDYSSVTHVDGTARVQIVRKDCQSVFRKIIEEYYERTGVPMLLNTSLNIRGRPMVDDVKDAKLWESTYNVKVF
jgi:carbamoyltransferase